MRIHYLCQVFRSLFICMTKQKIRFIINPISGKGKGKKDIAPLIDKHLKKESFIADIQFTSYAGHATLLAKQATQEGIDIVVAVGGDGTVNEVARGVTHSSTALGIIPLGSGNGLARHLGIPVDPIKAIEILNLNCIKALDYGKMNDQAFFCTCGVGFDAFVSHKFANAGKRGFLTYLENTLKEGLTYKAETYTISCEQEQKTYDAFLVACANASQYGNNAYIAPEASMSDGLLDVIIMKPFTVLEAPQIALQMINGTLLKNKHIIHLKTNHLTIQRQNEGCAHFDGEPITMGKSIEVKIAQGGIRVVVNPKNKKHVIPPIERVLDLFAEVQGNLRNEAQTLNQQLIKVVDRATLAHLKHKKGK